MNNPTDTLKASIARRDAIFMQLLSECLDRLSEAEAAMVHYGRPGPENHRAKHAEARERAARHRQTILESVKSVVESRSTLENKYHELAALTPPAPVEINHRLSRESER